MAIVIQHYGRASVRVDNTPVVVGSLELPISISAANEIIFHRVVSIANAANTTIYSDDLGNFDYLYLASDFDLRMKLTDSAANTFNLTLAGTATANKYGVPFSLGSDLTLNANTTLTTLQLFNTSGSTAKVVILAAD